MCASRYRSQACRSVIEPGLILGASPGRWPLVVAPSASLAFPRASRVVMSPKSPSFTYAIVRYSAKFLDQSVACFKGESWQRADERGRKASKPDYESGGREFESLRARQQLIVITNKFSKTRLITSRPTVSNRHHVATVINSFPRHQRRIESEDEPARVRCRQCEARAVPYLRRAATPARRSAPQSPRWPLRRLPN
jgi:hypothetical protein